MRRQLPLILTFLLLTFGATATVFAQPTPAVPQAPANWVDDLSFFGARTIEEDAAALQEMFRHVPTGTLAARYQQGFSE